MQLFSNINVSGANIPENTRMWLLLLWRKLFPFIVNHDTYSRAKYRYCLVRSAQLFNHSTIWFSGQLYGINKESIISSIFQMWKPRFRELKSLSSLIPWIRGGTVIRSWVPNSKSSIFFFFKSCHTWVISSFRLQDHLFKFSNTYG